MDAFKNTTRHTCRHCQQEVLTAEGYRQFSVAQTTKWRVPLRHDPDAVMAAAVSGCPFFVWLWDQLKSSGTPREQMRRTCIVLELEGMKLEGSPVTGSADSDLPPSSADFISRDSYDITGCTVKVETDFYTWIPGSFDVMSDWDDPSANHALARMIDGHTSSFHAIGQIRRRLQYCRAYHENCQSVASAIRPHRFLSVKETPDDNTGVKVVRVVCPEDSNIEPYAALSYCWGQDQVLKTTLANKLIMEAGVPVSLLPKTIQDAIRLTREMRINLLWVDSLCLVQDDEGELAEEIANMQHYYGNSCITISAATAKSCSEGFLRDEPELHTSEDDILGPFYFPVDLGIPEKHGQLKLVIRSSRVEAIDSRAWTLQEGLLSRRLVSFGFRIVRWSCQTESHGTYHHTHLRDSLRNFRNGIPYQPDGSYDTKWGRLKLWSTLIENYTARDLSNEQDRLPAISGIASILCQSQAKGIVGPLWDPRPRLSRGDADFHCPQEVPGKGPDDNSKLGPPLPILQSMSLTSAGPLGQERQVYYAAGLIEESIHIEDPMLDMHRGRLAGGTDNTSRPLISSMLILQLLWTRKDMAVRRQGQRPQPSRYVAPSWSWASHQGAVRTSITHIDVGLLNKIHVAIWDLGLRILDVSVAPRNPHAPYGTSNGGSVTMEGPIFQLARKDHMIARIAFDAGGLDDRPRGRRGLSCLQIIPELQGLQAKDVGQLCEIPHGIVIEPVDLDGQPQGHEKVYRRVGVYYIHYSDKGTHTSGEEEEDDEQYLLSKSLSKRLVIQPRPDPRLGDVGIIEII
ncbi:hypothetical protein N8I77_010560 [Diaporthe amygdali]|uniref:Heterokaryon incompatibility domain-containing protein n=1 Tax=Phomopsis amygdali TaxID=1214568 RepID=A0AAD9S7K8_PHOAM|nr:hypothetical protein N8I77_010560 [Diaporthe amygdali]